MTRSSGFFSGRHRDRVVSFYDFKGLIAPVFSCFNDDDDRSLNFEHIERYATWLKTNNVSGVIVNTPTGEGYAMMADERKLHAEFWWLCAQKHDLLCMIHIGNAPLPDVLDAAKHADELGVHAVVCSFDVYRQPRNVAELLAYCAKIADSCGTRPFFYHHNPKLSNVKINLTDFYDKAETEIQNFFGILYSDSDMDEGARCLRSGRVIILNTHTTLAPGLLVGFEAVAMTCININPKLCFEIFNTMKSNDLQAVIAKQKRLSDFIWTVTGNLDQDDSMPSMKNWFNEAMASHDGAHFSAGPTRTSF